MDYRPAGASLDCVTSQISALHLSHSVSSSRSCPSSSSALSSEEPRSGQECVGQVDEDELENVCSDDGGSDSFSISGSTSTMSVSVHSSVEEPIQVVMEDEEEERSALVPSLFPLFPPTLYFSMASEKVKRLPADQSHLLKWKMSTITPNIIKATITRSHFELTQNGDDWLGFWGHCLRTCGFKTIRNYQKVNHFPGTFQIGRKDRLCRNLTKMQARCGKLEFNFFPQSFILPQERKQLRRAWEDGGSRQKWIIKPPASARGEGIQVIHKWNQVPQRKALLVQKYLQKPYLINGSKFDLRIYVYVTSYDPLRVYIFSDGLVRFASCRYSSSTKTLSNKFMHLTNYSVNRKNSGYQTNDDSQACHGHKWALKALWQYLGSQGINTSLIWEKIKDIVIKTIITSESYVNSLLKMNVSSAYCCHELFGFDIILDNNLKPWILEVNVSPCLSSHTGLDVEVKGQMVRDLLNLAGFLFPQKVNMTSSCSSYSSSTHRGNKKSKPDVSTNEKDKQAFYITQCFTNQDICSTMLDILTPADIRVLAQSEDELSRRGQFERVFPSPSSSRYLRFFECRRYFNILLDQWERKYWNDRSKGISLLTSLCHRGVHLGNHDPAHMWTRNSIMSRFQPHPHRHTPHRYTCYSCDEDDGLHREISSDHSPAASSGPGSSSASSSSASL
ncbi:hypothetical protein LDENG_00145900 [Lucifuga dentata]|nr:hypothetical protein LDENG_00145900 [Lucifuga dentata]